MNNKTGDNNLVDIEFIRQKINQYKSSLHQKTINPKIHQDRKNIIKNVAMTPKKYTTKINKIIQLPKTPTEEDPSVYFMVKYENDNFIFYNKMNTEIGSFSDKDIINYIIYYKIMSDKINSTHKISSIASFDLIKIFICTISLDNNSSDFILNLKSHITSPFMGDIEMLIILNNQLKKYETNEIDEIINKYPYFSENAESKNDLINYVKYFIYKLNIHTLQIISYLTEQMKDDQNRKSIRESLLKYSCGITYRITNYVKLQINSQNDYLNSTTSQLNDLLTLKNTINDKCEKINKSINEQNLLLEQIKLNSYQSQNQKVLSHIGGSKKEVSEISSIPRKSTSDNSDSSKVGSHVSPTSDIIEEIIHRTKINSINDINNNHNHSSSPLKINSSIDKNVNDNIIKGVDISSLFDSENGFNSDSDNESINSPNKK